jgi:hypothetical protein
MNTQPDQPDAADTNGKSSLSGGEHRSREICCQQSPAKMDGKHWLEYATAAFALVAAIGSISAGVVGYFQWSVMGGQLSEMKAQRLLTIAQLRANLRRERPTMHPIGDKGQWISPGEIIAGWEINPAWTNAGSTDAINVISWWKLSIIPAPTISGGVTPVDCPVPPKPYLKLAPSVVPPNGPLVEQAQILSLSDAQRASGPNPSKVIEFAGRAEYNDTIPNTSLHYDNWCLIVVPHDLASSNFSFFRALEEVDR